MTKINYLKQISLTAVFINCTTILFAQGGINGLEDAIEIALWSTIISLGIFISLYILHLIWRNTWTYVFLIVYGVLIILTGLILAEILGGILFGISLIGAVHLIFLTRKLKPKKKE